MRKCDKFFEFIREKKFYGSNGNVSFSDWTALITMQLQGRKYDRHVLNNLM